MLIVFSVLICCSAPGMCQGISYLHVTRNEKASVKMQLLGTKMEYVF